MTCISWSNVIIDKSTNSSDLSISTGETCQMGLMITTMTLNILTSIPPFYTLKTCISRCISSNINIKHRQPNKINSLDFKKSKILNIFSLCRNMISPATIIDHKCFCQTDIEKYDLVLSPTWISIFNNFPSLELLDFCEKISARN